MLFRIFQTSRFRGPFHRSSRAKLASVCNSWTEMELLKKKKKRKIYLNRYRPDYELSRDPRTDGLFQRFQRDIALHGETRTGERGGQRTISNIYSLNFTIKKTLWSKSCHSMNVLWVLSWYIRHSRNKFNDKIKKKKRGGKKIEKKGKKRHPPWTQKNISQPWWR